MKIIPIPTPPTLDPQLDEKQRIKVLYDQMVIVRRNFETLAGRHIEGRDIVNEAIELRHLSVPTFSALPVRAETHSFTPTDGDCVLRVNATQGDVVVTLPSAQALDANRNLFRFLYIKKIDSGTNVVQILPDGGETIDDLKALRLHDTNEAVLIVAVGGAWSTLGRVRPAIVFEGIKGLVPSNGTDADHDIDLAAGVTPSSDGTQILRLAAVLVKQIDVAFAAGTNAGGMFTGAVAADTVYHAFLIRRDSDGLIDSGFDTSVTAANIPAGWTAFKRIYSLITDSSSNIIGFFASETSGGGLEFLWLDPPLDVDDSSSDSTAETRTLTVPTGYRVTANMNAYSKKPNYLSSLDVNDEPASDAVAPLANTHDDGFNHVSVRTNTSAQIRSRAFSGGDILRIATLGWMDSRRD